MRQLTEQRAEKTEKMEKMDRRTFLAGAAGVVLLSGFGSLVGCGKGSGGDSGGSAGGASGGGGNSEDDFVWDETTITGLTEQGKKQTQLVIPAKCTEVLFAALFTGEVAKMDIEGSHPEMMVNANDVAKTVIFEGDEIPKLSYSEEFLRGFVALESVVWPKNGVSEIPESFFYDCWSLTSFPVPAGVTHIAEKAFYNCHNLTEILFNAELESIGAEAFRQCDSLRSVSFPASLRTIGKEAFHGVDALEEITFSEGIEVIEYGAFWECPGLRTVVLPEGLTTLEKRSFTYCDKLESVYLPASLTSIDDPFGIGFSHQANPVIEIYVKEGSYADTWFDGAPHNDLVKKYY
ncbi:MAG: leucine-rich repeat domain-containing protein [Coriobacteriales bacterium]|jgi:hypothetical protein|nr:leucine-rich repeat domain-containing protein [Coriobacteriales bacterium]